MALKKERKLNRWQGYDYSWPGLYFVTICTKNMVPMFGEIFNYEMRSNEIGDIVKQQLLWLYDHFPYVVLDERVIMLNHLHMILEINYNFDDNKIGYTDKTVETGRNGKILGRDFNVGTGLDLSLHNDNHSKILPLYNVIGAFKTRSSKLIHQIGHQDFAWQRSFYDRVIRTEKELSNIRDYIINNPINWVNDQNNPKNIK